MLIQDRVSQGSLLMFQFRTTCPHCANQVDLAISHLFEYRFRDGNIPIFAHIQPEMAKRRDPILCHGCSACPICDGPMLTSFVAEAQDFKAMREAATNSIRAASGYTEGRLHLLAVYPEPAKPADDPAYPEQVREIFPELQEMAARRASPAIVVGGCRSVLEVACSALGGEGRNLQTKIDDLRQKGLLTEALTEWAHRLRLDGNQAVHEIKASAEQATELVDFVRLFLEVTFVLPKRIEAKRSS